MHTSPQKIGLIHFVGIGGIGMSGIAEVLHNLGYRVAGSDRSLSANTARLEGLGITVHRGHSADNLTHAAVVVISTAVSRTNEEVIKARELGIPIIHRSDMLAELMRLKPCIAISGTHGKTTTTSLIGCVLESGNFDPTVINGGIINAYGTNARLGTGDWMVVEADESDGSFLGLPATLGVITNIDDDHLDHYGSFDAVKTAFITFFKQIPFYGLGILCGDNGVIQELSPFFQDRRRVLYGLNDTNDIYAENIAYQRDHVQFDVVCKSHVLKTFIRSRNYFTDTNDDVRFERFHLPLLGEHNVQNALAGICVALELGISMEHTRTAYTQFAGVKRRFSIVDEVAGRVIIDDYAHHPTEIRTVLQAARRSAKNRVIAVLQPHRYSRLSRQLSEFAAAVAAADSVLVTPVYAAGETQQNDVDHTSLAAAINAITPGKAIAVYTQKEAVHVLADQSKEGDTILHLGAGDITKWAHELPAQLTTLIHNIEKGFSHD
ncbi:MAG: UDP-N-acetylmuramate--L-alanine ligase [Alphaproteobacteria bacterium]|nr:MAG: UDP-N-acetylmuramate--L-alanine ligase [Alphaproteobacteria bacterium]